MDNDEILDPQERHHRFGSVDQIALGIEVHDPPKGNVATGVFLRNLVQGGPRADIRPSVCLSTGTKAAQRREFPTCPMLPMQAVRLVYCW